MSEMDLSNQRIVVTGGAGFLGPHVVAALEQLGVPREKICVRRRHEYDLTSFEATCRLYDELLPDVVIHLAAEVGGIGANAANPAKFFYENMAMGLNLIHLAIRNDVKKRHNKVSKFLMVGTVCSYPKDTPVPFREADLWNGYPEKTNAPYGIAKKALLVMLHAYREQHALNGVYLIPVNLYGPGDNFDLQTSHVIPAMIRKFVEAKVAKRDEVMLWGTGSASREFLYVEDCAQAIVMATQRYDSGEPVNVGAGFEITMCDLAEKIRQIVGYEGRMTWDTTMPDGQPRRCLDTSRAKAAFGFEAQVEFDDGLRRTVDWYCRQNGITL